MEEILIMSNSKESVIPIIAVPSSTCEGNINLYNARSFLINGKYVESN